VLEEQVRQTIAGRVQRRNAWTLKIAREHATLVPFIGVDHAWARRDGWTG
jgi:hypothetical protein